MTFFICYLFCINFTFSFATITKTKYNCCQRITVMYQDIIDFVINVNFFRCDKGKQDKY